MKKIAIATFILGFATSSILGLAASGALAQDATAGKTLWEGNATQCKNCHGRMGEGALGPDLAGRGLSASQFQQAVRKPWGIMPAFTPEQVSDAELAGMAAYFAGLPKVAQTGPWRVPTDDNARPGQKVAISMGCAQCHGATFDMQRSFLGGHDVSFEQYRDLVYNHTVALPKMEPSEGAPGQRLHMGNYNPMRLSDAQLQEIYNWAHNDLGFRPSVEARLSGSGTSYTLKLGNSGVAQKGLTAQNLTIDIILPPGAAVASATGDGYQGVHADAAAKADVAEWRLAKLAPTDEHSFTLTLSAAGSGTPKGTARWTRPAPKNGANFDSVNFAVRPGA